MTEMQLGRTVVERYEAATREFLGFARDERGLMVCFDVNNSWPRRWALDHQPPGEIWIATRTTIHMGREYYGC